MNPLTQIVLVRVTGSKKDLQFYDQRFRGK